jgi:hypothetical protein
MARIRTIKPELWSSERFGECSSNARLMFVASLNFADDAGNLDRSSRQLKAQTLPYDNGDGEPLVAELLQAGLFIEYKVADRFYLHIKNFEIHQRVDRPTKSRLPLYDISLSTLRQLDDGSTSPRPCKGREGIKEGKVKDQEGMQGETSAARSTRIPSDFGMTPVRQKYAEEQGLNASAVLEAFKDYWTAASGAKARKNDWEATWRTWCRNQFSNGVKSKPYKPPRTTAEILAEEEREQQSAH